MYRIIEVADFLGVSKVTVYKKIEQLKPEIIAHIKNEDSVTYVSDYGVKLIKDSIKRRKTRKPRDKAILKVVELNCEIEKKEEKINNLEEEYLELKEQRLEELLINVKHLNAIINNKKNELKNLENSNNKLAFAIEKANELILMLERIN